MVRAANTLRAPEDGLGRNRCKLGPELISRCQDYIQEHHQILGLKRRVQQAAQCPLVGQKLRGKSLPGLTEADGVEAETIAGRTPLQDRSLLAILRRAREYVNWTAG